MLGLLLIGVTSTGVDNWAHVGGLLAGVVTAAFMRPRLLTDRGASGGSPALRAAPSLSVLAVVFFGQHLFADCAARACATEHDDAFGIAVPVPRGWVKGANPLGAMAWYQRPPGAGAGHLRGRGGAGAGGAAREEVQAYARRFVDESLAPRGAGRRRDSGTGRARRSRRGWPTATR